MLVPKIPLPILPLLLLGFVSTSSFATPRLCLHFFLSYSSLLPSFLSFVSRYCRGVRKEEVEAESKPGNKAKHYRTLLLPGFVSTSSFPTPAFSTSSFPTPAFFTSFLSLVSRYCKGVRKEEVEVESRPGNEAKH